MFSRAVHRCHPLPRPELNIYVSHESEQLTLLGSIYLDASSSAGSVPCPNAGERALREVPPLTLVMSCLLPPCRRWVRLCHPSEEHGGGRRPREQTGDHTAGGGRAAAWSMAHGHRAGGSHSGHTHHHLASVAAFAGYVFALSSSSLLLFAAFLSFPPSPCHVFYHVPAVSSNDMHPLLSTPPPHR